MTAADWNLVRSTFGTALERDPADRIAFLKSLDSDNPDLCMEVRRLLDNYEKDKSFLETPVVQNWAASLSLQTNTLAADEIIAKRYKINRLLGAGGMGEVYEVWDNEMRQTVALKVLPPALAERPEMVERFLREVRLAREVAHPGVCKTFDLGKCTDRAVPLFFLTMELIEGVTLSQRLARGDIPAAEAEALLMEIVEAVAAAHWLGVIHRDLKPGNVMLRRDPLASGHSVVITDFGLAKGTVKGLGDSSKTGSGQQVGTLPYMAPEQLSNEGVTKATDVYALGLIAHEVLTGRRPLQEEAPLAALIRRAKSAPPEPRSLVPSIPLKWNFAIVRCLSPDPNLRWPDACELAAALQSEKKVRKSVRISAPISRRQVMTLTGAAGATAAGAGFLWWAKHPPKDARVAAGTRILLMPAVNATGMRELDGLPVTFAAAVQQSAHLAISEPKEHDDQLKLMLKKPGDVLDAQAARHLALRVQIPLVAFATLTRVGSEFVLNVALERVNPSTERADAGWPESFRAANERQLHTALYEAARWLRRITGESEASITDLSKRPEEVTTDSWEALREYSKSQREADANDYPAAIVSLEAATRRDPLFAMAQMKRADFCIRQNRFAEGYGAWRLAIDAVNTRPPSRREELMIRSMHADDMQDFPKAVGYYKELMRVYPHVDYPWRYVSNPLMKMGRLEEAVAVMQELISRSGGASWKKWRRLLDYSSISAHFAVARQAFDELKKRNPPVGEIELAAFMLHASGEETQKAEEAFSEALRKLEPLPRSRHVTAYAHWLADQKRYAEAAELLSNCILDDARSGRTAERVQKLISWAVIESRMGNRRVVKPACLAAMDLMQSPQRMPKAAVVLARHGYETEALQAAVFLETVKDVPMGIVARGVIEAEICLSRGQHTKALRALRKVQPLRSKTDSKIEFARALVGAGQRDEAVQVLNDSLVYRHAEWVMNDVAIPLDYYDVRVLRDSLRGSRAGDNVLVRDAVVDQSTRR